MSIGGWGITFLNQIGDPLRSEACLKCGSQLIEGCRMDEELRRWFESADWSAVPHDLEYVADAARRYSLLRWRNPDLPVSAFVTDEERRALAATAERIRTREDFPRISEFIDTRPMTQHAESARIYGLLEVLDELAFRFE